MNYDDFDGKSWHLDRVIYDAKSAQSSTFTGTARLLDGSYDEAGTLSLGDGTALNSTREYTWNPTGSGVDIAFADGRFFHRLDLSLTQSEAYHFCDPDEYRVAYDFSKWPIWRATWRVTGPRKDYEMVSIYTPLA